MKTPFPEKLSEAESIRAFADACVKRPGMYLMALRTHVNKSGNALGEMLDKLGDTMPKASRAVQDPE